MRAQTTASDGYCTVLGSRVLYSAVTLARARKRHGIETYGQTFSKGAHILSLIGFAFSYMRLGRDFSLPITATTTITTTTGSNTLDLICANSQIEPLREGLTKDGDDDVCCGY
jgi:hypothetical protein